MGALPNIAEQTPLWLLLVTTLVGAVEGAGIGRRSGADVDIVGMAVFALFLGLGGGLARDTLLGLPAAAIQSFWYPTVIVVGIALVLLFGRWIPTRGTVSVGLDALTLGLYAAVGTQKALDYHFPAIGAVVVGLFASVAGGVIVSRAPTTSSTGHATPRIAALMSGRAPRAASAAVIVATGQAWIIRVSSSTHWSRRRSSTH